MADEHIKVPLRPIIAVGLAVVVSGVGAVIITPPDPVSTVVTALACFVLQGAANLVLLRRLRSWSLAKAAALAALLDCLIVLCAYAAITLNW
jgi:hypothetical protein